MTIFHKRLAQAVTVAACLLLAICQCSHSPEPDFAASQNQGLSGNMLVGVHHV